MWKVKKRTRKLNLNRETLHQLDARGLRGVAGGAFTDACADTTNFCRRESNCACETEGCGTTGSACPSMTTCSNC